MFDAAQYVASPWLHGSDLSTDGPTILTVKAAREHTFDDGTTKPVVSFYETAQELVLNRTQTKAMIGLFGSNAGAWLNQRVSLMPVASAFEGKPSVAIGRAPAETPPSMSYQQAPAAAPQQPAPAQQAPAQPLPVQPEVRYQ